MKVDCCAASPLTITYHHEPATPFLPIGPQLTYNVEFRLIISQAILCITTTMNGCCTPPHSELATTTFTTPPNVIPYPRFATPVSLEYGSPETMPVQNTHSLELLTQTQVNSSAEVKRLQQDLLILTGFNDNSTLHWRPVWFTHRPNSKVLWTLHNPPNVVTERLPNDCKRNQLFTRRMRRTDDPPPQYIKSWSHWKRYCLLYDVPDDFLSEGQVRLLRMGLSRSPDGLLCSEFSNVQTFYLYSH